MNGVMAAAAVAVAWMVIRTRPDQRSRLKAIAPAATSERPRGGVAPLRRLVSRFERRRQGVAGEAATVEAVFALAAELRAGRPPSRALSLVATQSGVLSESLAIAAGAVASGASAGDELRRLAHEPGCAGWRGVAAAWEVTSRAGGPVAEVLDRLGEVLDTERNTRTALAAAMAGSRATTVLLAALPMFGIATGQALGARPLHLLVHRPLGWVLLTGAVVLDASGMLWTRVIIKRALR